MKRHHVFGPPGTGKTTDLIKQTEAAARKYNARDIVVCSFTRAAAAEVRNRNPAVEPDNIGTIHSLARSCAKDKRRIAEDKIEDWNQWTVSHGMPSFVLTRAATAKGGVQEDLKLGDNLFLEMNLRRSRRQPIKDGSVAKFTDAWETWKDESDLVDFPGMLERALDVHATPGSASGVLMVDEAQDMDALQSAVVQHWASAMEHVVLFGDDDQCIYTWSGADAQHMIGTEPDSARILKQSYRMPAAVHHTSQRFIKRFVSSRVDKEFSPRGEEGSVGRIDNPLQSAPWGATKIAYQAADAGRDVMILASCGYMLKPVIKDLRERGIPFHNPYRVEEGAWNPMRFDGKSTAHRVWCYMQGFTDRQYNIDEGPVWTGAQMMMWLELLDQRGVLRVNKKEIVATCETNPSSLVTPELWAAWFREDPWEDMGQDLAQAGRWLRGHTLKAKSAAVDFPLRVAAKGDLQRLTRRPNIVVGTIHSVKGAQADVVILAPEMSGSMAMETAGYRPGVKKESAVENAARLFYVGMTRAKEELWVTRPELTRRGVPRSFPGLY